MARCVDRLLSSPQFGERWGRHWLDVARYAESNGDDGLGRNPNFPHAWRYRDYVIASLNADKPYGQFLREQIAGDVIAPGDPAALVATGFLAAGPWDFVGHVETKSDMLKRAARAGDLDDMVTQVITSTMGVTIHCARCHDHKIDPISQREYYSLWAVFSGVKRDNREVDPAESKRLRAEKERLQQQHARVQSEVLKLSGGALDLADMAQQHGMEVAIARVHRVCGEQPLDLGERRFACSLLLSGALRLGRRNASDLLTAQALLLLLSHIKVHRSG